MDEQTQSTMTRSATNFPSTKPKFPLTAYNLFFQVERKRILQGMDHAGSPAITPNEVKMAAEEHKAKQGKRLHRKTHGKISFKDLARIVANRWKQLDDSIKGMLEELAKEEKEEYRIRLEEWKQSDEYKQTEEYRQEMGQTLLEKGSPCSVVSDSSALQQGYMGRMEHTVQNPAPSSGNKCSSSLDWYQVLCHDSAQQSTMPKRHQRQVSFRILDLIEEGFDFLNESNNNKTQVSTLSMNWYEWESLDQGNHLEPTPIYSSACYSTKLMPLKQHTEEADMMSLFSAMVHSSSPTCAQQQNDDYLLMLEPTPLREG